MNNAELCYCRPLADFARAAMKRASKIAFFILAGMIFIVRFRLLFISGIVRHEELIL